MTTETANLSGQAVLRREDARILVGAGSYVDDIHLPDMLHAAFVRSAVPHAMLAALDVERARALPGVVAIYTGEDAREHTMALQFPMEFPGLVRPSFWPLAVGKVLHVGDPIAIVVAESRALAEDARDAVDVHYEPIAAVANVDDSQDPAGPVLFDDVGTNLMYSDSQIFGDPDAAFAQASHVVHHRIEQQRVSHVPIETRGMVADYDSRTDDLTVYAACQGPHRIRVELASILNHPADRLRVIAPDVGGSFGQKAMLGREDFAVALAAKLVRRPVKWIEDRTENLISAAQAREETIDVRAAVAEDGSILALDVSLTVDHGAYYLRGFPVGLITVLVRTMFPGPYRIGAMRWQAEVWATNKAPYGSYRGPWAVETLGRETLIDRIANELGLEPFEVRRRNLFTLEEQPSKMVTGATVEGVTAQETLRSVEESLDLAGFRERQSAAREGGRLIGVGFSCFMEAAPGPPDYANATGFVVPPEQAIAYLEPDGRLTISSGQSPHGQGHVTTLTQIAADASGFPMESIRIVLGDTHRTPFHSIGTGGSRAASQASGAVRSVASAIREVILGAGAELLQASVSELTIADGKVIRIDAPEQAIYLAQLAAMSYYAPKPLAEAGFRTVREFGGPAKGGWSVATHACVVEVDPETGCVDVVRYIVAEDCGSIINPGIVDGQIRGGVTQGIGLALLEQAAYGEDGMPLARTLFEYTVPTAVEIPRLEIIHVESDPLDEVNHRGIGEGPMINAPAAVVNAVADAVGRLAINSLPLTPQRVLELLVDRMDAPARG